MGNVSIVISGPSFNIHSYLFNGKRVMDIKQSNIAITAMVRLKYAITYLSLNNTSVFGCVFLLSVRMCAWLVFEDVFAIQRLKVGWLVFSVGHSVS